MKKIILLLSIISASILFESCKDCQVYIFNKRIEKRHKVKKDDSKTTLADKLKNFMHKK